MKNKIREYRARFEMTQAELAGKAGITRQSIIAMERGKYDPSLKVAFRLAEIFGTTVEGLFYHGE
jgi:putative transcriptional regulator